MNLFFKKIISHKKFFVVAFCLSFAFLVKAQNLDILGIKNDFVLEPGKVEVFANPGDLITKSVTVTNRASSNVSFKIEVEDFIGSDDEDRPVVLLGDEKSPYSFKDNVVPELKNFTLRANESITVPIKINIPINAQPGGFYTSILVSNEPSIGSDVRTDVVEGKTKIVSRVGTLFFIRVNGVTKESGSLDDFKIVRPTKDNPDLYNFSILFKNDGNVHLVPFGWITVNNIWGKTIDKIPVDAYFSMPKSIRYRDVEWKAPFLLGRFKALVELNRGYGSNLIDTKTVAFWVIPWKIIAIIASVVLFITLALYLFFRKFKFVSRQ